MKMTVKRILVLAFTLSLLLSLTPLSVSAAAESKAAANKTVLIAASDFQSYEDAHNTCKKQMLEIFDQIKKDYSHADGFLFAGDYYHEYSLSESERGMKTLLETIRESGMGIDEDNILMTQGNHDWVGVRGLSPTGPNDPADGSYGVFAINEDDFMWFAGSGAQNGTENISLHEMIVQETAEELGEYLAEKAEEGFTKPIFVVSHVPLHYSMRTYVYGDGRYARYLVDELNWGAAQGLNIIFLFGHDHSHGWDNHLGGSSIYLKKGDVMNVSNSSNPRYCYQQKIGFTYLNAGYVGYFTTDNNEPVDKTLTMTVYEISDTQVIIKRYSKDGLHDLKSKGVYSLNRHSGFTEEQYKIFTLNPTVYPSGQTVNLVTKVVEEKKSTCTVQGNNSYYYTAANGKYYKDYTLLTETTPQKELLPLVDHSYTFSYTSTSHTGVCKVCKTKLASQAHHFDGLNCTDCAYKRTLTKVDAVKPSCTSTGNNLYYYDPNTKSYYLDAGGKNPTTLQAQTLPKTAHAFDGGYEVTKEGHRKVCSCGEKDKSVSAHSFNGVTCSVCGYKNTLLIYEAKASTCQKQGNKVYYMDPSTHIYYKDAGGKTVTTPEKELLPLAAHQYGSDHLCAVCGAKDPDYKAPATPTSPATSTRRPTSPSSSSKRPTSVPASSAEATASSSAPLSSSSTPASSVPASSVPAASDPVISSTAPALTSSSAEGSPSLPASVAPTSSTPAENNNAALVIGIVGGVILAAACAAIIVVVIKKKKK